MMKTEKWMPMAAFAALLVATTSCEDWGKQDPPAGNQVYPTLQNVAKYDFQAEEGLDPAVYRLVANPGGETPQVVDDEEKGKVLEVNNGYLTVSNPLTSVVLQNAASLTFWLKVEEAANLSAPLIAFEDESGSAGLSVAADGTIRYKAADGEWQASGELADYVTPGEWHYMAMALTDTGYDMTVDGENNVNKQVADFDCSKMVAVANAMSDLKIGSSSDASKFYIDDLTVYRNTITAKETARPSMSGGGASDMSSFEYVVGDPIREIGASDCSSGFWSEFSNYFRIPAETSMHFSLINHGSGGGNWNNWNMGITTDDERGGNDYSEYLILRSDLYGWGSAYDGGKWTSSGYDWDTFIADMQGAKVDITVERSGATVTMTAVATTTSGKVLTESIYADCGDANDVIRVFFLVDSSYLEMNLDDCYAYWPEDIQTLTIGASDCSSGFWTEFSDYFSISPNMCLHLGFKNQGSGGGNWNNWNMGITTDDDRGGSDYSEYLILRSDLYGWGNVYDGGKWTSSGYDWDTFIADMQNSEVCIDVVRSGATVTVTAVATTTAGKELMESIYADCDDGTQVIRAFLLIDGSYLQMHPEDCYTYKPLF